MIPTNKKIAVLHAYLTKVWWASNMMIYLSNFLSNNNNVTFYTFSYNKDLFSKNKFEVKYFKLLKILAVFKIAYDIKDKDYIFIWNSPMHFVWVISKILFRSKAKIIWWHHHYPWYYSKNANVYIKWKWLLEKSIITKIDLLVSNSKYLQKAIKDIYKLDSKILYPVLDDKFLKHNSENKKNTSESNIIFTYGRWGRGKNLKLIFQTYLELKNKVPNLVLIIWWDWSNLQKYKNKFNTEENIKFLWHIDKEQIIKTLSKSSLFLFPSKIDSFWLVILESMSVWVPVISYNKSWAKEIIKNWVNWFLVDSDKEFIEKSYSVLLDPSLRQNLWKAWIKTSRDFWSKTFEKQLNEIFSFI